MKIENATIADTGVLLQKYEQKFGECPVGVLDGGGPVAFLELLRDALAKDKPIEDPYKDLPADVIVA